MAVIIGLETLNELDYFGGQFATERLNAILALEDVHDVLAQGFSWCAIASTNVLPL